jgi:hypothetical protein
LFHKHVVIFNGRILSWSGRRTHPQNQQGSGNGKNCAASKGDGGSKRRPQDADDDAGEKSPMPH